MTAPIQSGHGGQIADADARRSTDGSNLEADGSAFVFGPHQTAPGALTECAKHDDTASGANSAKTKTTENEMNAQTEVRPGGIFAALAAAKADVKRIAKDNRNTEQKYDFASVDDFMAMVGPICAKHGLVTIVDEDSIEFVEKAGKYGNTFWVRIAYQITTYHADGDHTPTVRRNIEVIRSGPQAYGSAQSYILKQYYRGLLEIPTGDKDDPDFGGVDEQAAAPRQAPKPDAIPRAVEYLAEADSLDTLQTRWGNIPNDVKADQRVIAAKEASKARLTQKPAADLGGDKIPY